MSWGVANSLMLLGLAGAAIPVVIHLLNHRWDPVIDWGAMQFLEIGERSRRRVKIQEWLLMLARMGLLAIVALALARPFWKPSAAAAGSGAINTGSGSRRDVVLVLDASASMDRRVRGTTPRAEALAWAKRFVARLGPGDSVAVVQAADRVRGLVDPPSFDHQAVALALAKAAEARPSRGSSDLPAAVAEAFRILERTQNPARDVIVLTDGQRFAWRPGEPARWNLLRELHRRLPVPPVLWAMAFGAGHAVDAPNGSVAPLELSRSLLAPGLPVEVRAAVANSGPGPLTTTAELVLDGKPVPRSAQVVGSIAAGGRAPLQFRTAIDEPGSHLVAVRLTPGDDGLAADDEAVAPVEVAAALPLLLVDGEPGLEPFRGETDFLRAALAPARDEAPLVRATVVKASAFRSDALQGQRVVVLANIDHLPPASAAAIERFLARGGGVWVVPGSRCEAEFWNAQAVSEHGGWLPALLGEFRGELARREEVAHPLPRSFSGKLMTPFGQSEAAPLGAAKLFGYWRLEPVNRKPAAAVVARLDNGDPWLVERPHERGRVLITAGPLDADGGTLPVNPDFVPWVHEVVFHLADNGSHQRVVRPGEPITIALDPAPSSEIDSLPITTPGGEKLRGAVVRSAASAQLRFENTIEPGVYSVDLADPPGRRAYAVVSSDAREEDLAPLEPAESAQLARGWPMVFETRAEQLAGRLLARGSTGRQEVWRFLVLAALAGLCLEVWLTRQLVRGREVAP